MKKIILLFLLFAGAICIAKKPVQQSVTFYGIDFNKVSVYGAGETPRDFINAFDAINSLLVAEPDKYITPLEVKLNLNFDNVDLSFVQNRNKDIDPGGLKSFVAKSSLTDKEIVEEVKSLDISGKGEGLVVIAMELNKSTDIGTYYYVFFNEKDGSVINVFQKRGQSGGMGLRNYWARSFARSFKNIDASDLQAHFNATLTSVKSAAKTAAKGVKNAAVNVYDDIKTAVNDDNK